MKKVIDGKTYNTDTAMFICETGNALPNSDFKWEISSLYKTKKGAFFIAGAGGALSRFPTITGNRKTEGRGLILLTNEEALELFEKHGKAKNTKEFFDDIIVEA